MSGKLAIIEATKAHHRQCPMSFNDGPGRYCLGPDCMAWRWFVTNVNDPPPSTGLVERGDVYGFCGLAGAPEARR
jgi:hypothetical protein